ncbi:hypothetical protein TWF718_011125 [Orbilia javanica]|uniref:protein S-acyltransferase n=1 Tax=Orbilia javanica TaxID=47235 RepID=A0AAN8MIM2_9PEZI
MASTKNRGTYRAVGLSQNTTEEDFRSVLTGYLTPEERTTITLKKLRLAPSPTDHHSNTQTAIFRFTGGTPKFLEKKHITGKYEESIEIDTDFWGLTQLYHTEGEIKLDIVALTGLNAHAYGSWSGTTKDDTNPMWLQDYLSGEANLGLQCRSMIYGYNAKTANKSSHDTNDYCKSLLNELRKARQGHEERPLVLLGHSYGGLIISHAFTKASWEEDYIPIYRSIVRIFCFGVPYRGINLEDVERQVNSNKNKFSQGIELLKSILYEGGRITPNTEQFRHLLQKSKTKLVSFYETIHTKKVEKVGNGTDEFARCGDDIIVVPRDSAVLGLGRGFEEDYDTDGDHSTIVKFTIDDERENQRQEEIANSISSAFKDPAEARYMRSQMLRVAADANLRTLAKKLLKVKASAEIDPNLQAHDPKYKQYRENSLWLFDGAGATQAPEQYKNTVAEILDGDLTALALATRRGNDGMVKLLLKNGANPNIPCSSYQEGRTPLHEASRQSNHQIVKYLLKRGANPNARSGLSAGTPLHEVAYYGGLIAPMLLERKADIGARKEPSGDTPLHLAAEKGHVTAVRHLLGHGADPAERNNSGMTPLHRAVEDGRTKIVLVLLLEVGNRHFIDIQDNDGETALHKAIQYEEVEITRVLLEKGADINITTNDGRTAIDLASEAEDDRIEALVKTYQT